MTTPDLRLYVPYFTGQLSPPQIGHFLEKSHEIILFLKIGGGIPIL